MLKKGLKILFWTVLVGILLMVSCIQFVLDDVDMAGLDQKKEEHAEKVHAFEMERIKERERVKKRKEARERREQSRNN